MCYHPPCSTPHTYSYAYLSHHSPLPSTHRLCIFSPHPQVTIGNIEGIAGNVTYMEDSTSSPDKPPSISSVSLSVIIPAVVVPVTIVFLCSVVWIAGIVLVFRRKYTAKQTEQQTLTAESNELAPLKSGQLLFSTYRGWCIQPILGINCRQCLVVKSDHPYDNATVPVHRPHPEKLAALKSIVRMRF